MPGDPAKTEADLIKFERELEAQLRDNVYKAELMKRRQNLPQIIKDLEEVGVDLKRLQFLLFNSPGRPKRDFFYAGNLYCVIMTCRKAKNVSVLAACEVIASLGGYPRFDTTNERHQKPTAIKDAFYNAKKAIENMPPHNPQQKKSHFQLLDENVQFRLNNFHASGLSYENWERPNLEAIIARMAKSPKNVTS